jgi:OFA family oxalate/formate antiporter-like MFS transporter
VKINNRWFQLCASLVAMIMIANLQYAWTLFVKPLQQATGWKLSEIQYAATLFILFQTWVQPAQGWLIDRMGPRVFFSIAAVLCAAGWGALGHATSLPVLYTLYVIAGIGAAFVYSGSIGSALKWFQSNRGLAAGIMAAGFGGGSALFIPVITSSIRTQGYSRTFLWTGLFQGLVILIVAQFLRHPEQTAAPTSASSSAPAAKAARHQYTTREMVATPQFYFLYAAFVMMSAGGLLLSLNAGPIASSWGISAAALATALFFGQIFNGMSRIFWGWVSDLLGRESTIVVAFLCNAAALFLVITLGRQSSTWFVATYVLTLFTWGEIYALFPAILGDYYGTRHATSNTAILYTAKGAASIFSGGVAALLFEHFGTWSACLYGSAVLALTAAAIAYGLRASAAARRVAVVLPESAA